MNAWSVLSWTLSPPRPHTLNSTSMSKAYQSTFTGETNTPYSKQFVHSKSSQYRRLRTEWKNNVYLARSRIQGLGLYAAKDLEKHTMVIEYIGTIIRNEVANRREKIYEEQVLWGGWGVVGSSPPSAKGHGAGLDPGDSWREGEGRRNWVMSEKPILVPTTTSACLEPRHLHVPDKQ